jgi:NADPH:quinone reductase-like Zn-dependent oxidoreductase
MKAIYLSAHAGVTSLHYGNLPQPLVHDADILIKVHAAAIMPHELGWPSTLRTRAGDPRPFPIVLGHQFSGVVASIGAMVDTPRVGDAVYGITDWFSDGAQAEYCIAPATSVATKPRLLDHVHASVLPIPALAAWHGLFDVAKLQSHHRILIHGATDSVGIIAVQLARWRGARITATAPTADHAFVRLLGADTVIDDQTSACESAATDADVVFDCIGCEALERSSAHLIAGGRFATMARRCASTSGPCIWESLLLLRSHAAPLSQIGNLIDAGEIRVFVDSVYPLARTKRAYAKASRRTHIGAISARVVE